MQISPNGLVTGVSEEGLEVGHVVGNVAQIVGRRVVAKAVWGEVLDGDSCTLFGAFSIVGEDAWVDGSETRTTEDYKPLDRILVETMFEGLIKQNRARMSQLRK